MKERENINANSYLEYRYCLNETVNNLILEYKGSMLPEQALWIGGQFDSSDTLNDEMNNETKVASCFKGVWLLLKRRLIPKTRVIARSGEEMDQLKNGSKIALSWNKKACEWFRNRSWDDVPKQIGIIGIIRDSPKQSTIYYENFPKT